MTIVPIIIEQHFEEAAFNWLLRDRAVGEPHYDLSDLARLDGRVEGNLDGLRISGEDVWRMCQEAMVLGEPGEIFTAGVLAFESQVPERMDILVRALREEHGLQRPLVSALGWINFDTIAGPVRRLLGADLPYLKYIGLAAHAVHRRDPGAPVPQLIEDSDGRVRSIALRAAGELGRLDLLPSLRDHFQDENVACRFFAAQSATLLGDSSSMEILMVLALNKSSYAHCACRLAARTMTPDQAMEWLHELGRHAESLSMVASAHGASGDPAAMTSLLEMMRVPELARPAGEAFAKITGVDIAYEDLEGAPPEKFEAGPTENSEDEDVAMDPDGDLPWPDPELIGDWWQRNKANFKSGVRYLCGKPISDEQCQHVLRYGYQRQRAAAAIELAMMHPGTPLINVEAPGFRQQRLLGLK